MAIRGWQKGVFKLSQWAVKLAREGFNIPVPQSVLIRIVRKVDDPSVRDLRLEARDEDRLVLSGLKKKGMWVDFSATFTLEPPGEDEPPQSLALNLETTEPFFARGPLLGALAGVDGIKVKGDRALVDLGEIIQQNQWGRKIPEAVRGRLRIMEAHSSEGRVQLRLGLA
ncbi:hypothetical protein [Thiohalorhabdus sp.]|uniref:hypothetical protein n=1 Tax=Thiohalorhabdus sp. TaxID=3094134 RepID=UPI002FC288B0